MLGTQKFNETIDILYKAYTEGTLMHGHCHACAVGNLVADACNYTFDNTTDRWKEGCAFWGNVFFTPNAYSKQHVFKLGYEGEAKAEIDSTGYSWQDLARIEHAFETASKTSPTDDWELNGLLAVVDVLKDIHSTDGVVAKKRFMELA